MLVCLPAHRRNGNRYENKMFCIYVAKIMFNNPVKYGLNWTCISDVGIESSNCMDFWVSVIK